MKTAVTFLLILLVSLVAFAAPADPPAYELARVERDIVYTTVNDHPLHLDLYLPQPIASPSDPNTPSATPAASPHERYPVILWIHGGAWRTGSKAAGGRVRHMIRHGYAIADINYRLSQQAPYPAAFHDCQTAVRWVRAHADQYNLDPNHVGAAGGSAGGHLVALLGTYPDTTASSDKNGGAAATSGSVIPADDRGETMSAIRTTTTTTTASSDKNDAPAATSGSVIPPDDRGETMSAIRTPAAETDDYPEFSSRLQAVCDLFGPSDLLAMPSPDQLEPDVRRRFTPNPVDLFLGGPAHMEPYRSLAIQASPVTWVSHDDPPFLILHGRADRVVPYQQSAILHDALRKAGVPSTLILVPEGNHGLNPHWNTGNFDQVVANFFNKHLKQNSDPPDPQSPPHKE